MQLNEAEVEKFRVRNPRSKELWEKTKEIIPTGHGGGMGYFLPHPIMVDHAKGCWIWDVDGNRYLDMRIGDWVLIHGHCDDDIRDAVMHQMERSVQIGGPEWDLGYRMAKLLVDRVPTVDKVRFFVSGTDANMCAIRMCRIATGRMKIAKASGSYHGTADVLLVGSTILRDPAQWAPPGLLTGADQGVVEIPFNDPDGAEAILERHAADIAAVLIEPVQGSAGMIEATGEYLQRLRDVTTKLGIILIFDEVVTFPVAYGGAQTHFGVMPDLTVMGKVIGGGLPCSAVGGRADLMDLMEPDAHDGQSPMNPMATFGGNQIAMAAGIACLEKLTPQEHDRINALGIKIMEGIDELGRRYDIPLHSSGLGHLIGLHWGPERVVDFRTRLLDDREKVVNIMMALVNEDIYQTYTGMFLLSTAIGEPEVDHFMTTFEKCLHTLGYVS